MATLSDVENAIQGLIYAPIYPNGSPPSAVAHPVKIYAGWPDPQQLDIDLVETSGLPVASHVSIYPLPAERNTTRYSTAYEEAPIPAATYAIDAYGQVITIGGSAPSVYVPQNIVAYLNETPYLIQATAGQTAAQVAAVLLAAIVADFPGATVSGSAITLPAGVRIGALRVGTTGSASKVVRQQEKSFQISVWTSSPALRALIADTFDPVMADTPRMTLADGSIGRLIYHATRDDDFSQKARIYRRSLIWSVEYATLRTIVAPQLIVPKVEFPGLPVIDILDFEGVENAILETLI